MAETAEFNPMGMMMPMMVMMMMMGVMGSMLGGTSGGGGDTGGGDVYVPNDFQCMYCSDPPFLTLEELQAHVAADHPGERIPTSVVFS